jgi:hypothetical protein
MYVGYGIIEYQFVVKNSYSKMSNPIYCTEPNIDQNAED